MKKVLVLGATGMLGSAVYDVLKDTYELVLSVRDNGKVTLLETAYGGTKKHRTVEFDASKVSSQNTPYYRDFLRSVGAIDYVINAIGITATFAEHDPTLTYFINGKLPHILADTFGEKLIHIATDGVFDGVEGYPYTEHSTKHPVGIYAESKSLGEPANCLTLRTSIVGPELEGATGLLEWFLEQNGKTIHGFTNHVWNGITAKEFGNICDRIMSQAKRFPRTGLYHVFSTTVSKYDMLCAFKEKFKVECEIIPDDTQSRNRTLATIYTVNADLKIPTFKEMIAAL